MSDRSKFRECIAPPILSEYSLQTVKQYRPLEKRLTKLKLRLIFSWFIYHKKLYVNNENSNYMRNPFTSPTSAKMSTNRTQNEKNSQRKRNCVSKNLKKLKSCFTQSFKISPSYFFIQSSLAQLTGTVEI